MSYEEPEELPIRPRRRLLEPIPIALLSVLMIACGFIGGVLAEKGQSNSSSTGLGGGVAARFASGGFGRAGAGTRGATVGDVSYIAGSILYVANAEGDTVKVTTSESSSITKTVRASIHGIHPGDTVIVQGTPGKGGAISATSIGVSSRANAIGGGLAALFGSPQSSSRSGPGSGGGVAPEATGGGGPALFGPG